MAMPVIPQASQDHSVPLPPRPGKAQEPSPLAEALILKKELIVFFFARNAPGIQRRAN